MNGIEGLLNSVLEYFITHPYAPFGFVIIGLVILNIYLMAEKK